MGLAEGLSDDGASLLRDALILGQSGRARSFSQGGDRKESLKAACQEGCLANAMEQTSRRV